MFSQLALWCSSVLLASAAAKTSKRGLAFAAEDTPGDLNNANQTKSHISWQYDWAMNPAAYLANSGIEYIPMQWGSGKIELFADAVKAQGAKTVLAFNEPDYDKESNMLPSEAAKLWKQYLEPLKADGIRLGGPAVTAASTGRPWMTQFMTLCTNCSVDFIPIHWYGEGEEGFYNYLWDVHTAFPNKTIWVTEYATTSANMSEVARFLNVTTTYMDALDWIERYAWFGFFRPKEGLFYNLLDEQGGLNVLGQMYVGAKTVHTQIISHAPSKTYQTVNGADNPTQGLVTTYPAAFNGAVQHWTVFADLHLWSLGTALVGSFLFYTYIRWDAPFFDTVSVQTHSFLDTSLGFDVIGENIIGIMMAMILIYTSSYLYVAAVIPHGNNSEHAFGLIVSDGKVIAKSSENPRQT